MQIFHKFILTRERISFLPRTMLNYREPLPCGWSVNPPFYSNPHMTPHQVQKMKMSSLTPNQNEKYPNQRKTHATTGDPRIWLHCGFGQTNESSYIVDLARPTPDPHHGFG
jgi:hypothetical protein